MSKLVRPGHQCSEPMLEELQHTLKGLQSDCHQVERQTHQLLEKHHAEVLQKLEVHEEILLRVLGCAHSHGVPEKVAQVAERQPERRVSERHEREKGVAFDLVRLVLERRSCKC